MVFLFFFLTWFPFHWYLVMLRIFPIYIGHFYVFYEEMSIDIFCTFFSQLFAFYFSSYIIVVTYMFWILILHSDTTLADTSSHSIGCLSIDVEETILFFICFNWRLITLQYCGGFCHTLTWISHGCTCVPRLEPPFNIPPHPIPQDHPSAPALSTLSHTSNLDWWSISHMIIYMFQCYSLKSSHPHLLPQSPKVYSLHLCLFGYLVYKVIITTFLNSTYMC